MDFTNGFAEELQRRGETIQTITYVKFVAGVIKKGKGSVIRSSASLSFLVPKQRSAFSYSWLDLREIHIKNDKFKIYVQKDLFVFEVDQRRSFKMALEETLASLFYPSEISKLKLKGIEVPQNETPLNPLARLASICRARSLQVDPNFWSQFAEFASLHKVFLDLSGFQQAQEVEDLLLDHLHLFSHVRVLKVANRNGCSRALMRYLKRRPRLTRIELLGPVGKVFREFLDIVQETNIRIMAFHDSEFNKDQLDILNEKVVQLDLEELGLHNAIQESFTKHFYQLFVNTQLVDHVVTLNLAGSLNLDLAVLLPKLRSAAGLCLAQCGLEIADVLELVQKAGFIHLQTLDLSGNSSTKPVARTTRLPKPLKVLKVNNIRWENTTLSAFLSIILASKKDGHIKLCISHASLLTRDWSDFFSGVEFLPSEKLFGLEWDGNPVDSRFFEFLKRQDLCELSMSTCIHASFVDPAYSLGDLIRTSKQLRLLAVNSTADTFIASGMCVVIEACIAHPSLEELSLTNSQAGTGCLMALWALLNVPSCLRIVRCDGIWPIVDVNSYLRFIQDITTSPVSANFACPISDLTALLNSRLISKAQFDDMVTRCSSRTERLTPQSSAAIPDEGDLLTYASVLSITTLNSNSVKFPQIPVILEDVDPRPLDFSMVPPRPRIVPWRKSASISQHRVQPDIVSRLKYKWDLSEELIFPPLPTPSFDPVTWENIESEFSLENLYQLLRNESQDLSK